MITLKHVAAASISLLAVTAQAGLINGNFDDQTGASTGKQHGLELSELTASKKGWDVYDELNGWSTVYGPGIEVQRSGRVVDAQSGEFYVELDSHPSPGNSGMEQSLSGLVEGASYDLTFWYQARTSKIDDNGLNIYSYEGAFDYDTTVVGMSIDESLGEWTKYSYVFEATANSMNIAFAAFGDFGDDGGNTLGAFLDSVELNMVPGSDDVPEPGALALLALGLLGLGVARRKQK